MGSHLAKMLSGNNHDITVVDSDPKLLSEVASLADVITVEGDSTTLATLRRAAVRRSDLFIAVNHEENDNIVAAMLAKKLGAKKSIARIDNNEYLEPNNKEMFIDMGIDYLFYPEKIAAREVINLLGHTSTTEFVDFSSGKLSLAVFHLEATSPLIGQHPAGRAEGEQLAYRTVAITRDGQTIIPDEEEQFVEGDVAYLIVRHDAMQQVMELSGQKSIAVKNMMILGGSRIGVQIVPIGAVSTYFETEFETAGINQTRHKIFLTLETSVSLIVPADSRMVQVTSTVPIAASIIVGHVPDSFVDVSDEEDMLNLIP